VSIEALAVEIALTSSSSISHGAQCLGPRLMTPIIGTEILRPLFPRRTYSAFEFSRDFLRGFGSSRAAIVDRFQKCGSEKIEALLDAKFALRGKRRR
jgi:hypothetical protein